MNITKASKDIIKSIVYETTKPILGRVKKFYKIHNNESCYIFGDGVSIKEVDLTLFSNKVSISTNNFILHKDLKSLNNPYCVINAPFLFSPFFGYPKESKTHLNNMAKVYKTLINENSQTNYFINLSNYPFIRNKNIFYTFNNIPDDRLTNNFIGNRIDTSSGVLRHSIMMAIYLGFDHIYLVGCDYTHSPSFSRHWYEKGRGVLVEQKNYQKDFFEIAKEFIDITTITIGGTSEFIKSVTYKEFTGKEPGYRENTELVDDKYLKILSLFSGYHVYEEACNL